MKRMLVSALRITPFVLVLLIQQASADPTGDPIDHLWPMGHAPDTFHSGAGIPLGPITSDSCLVVDITTATVAAGEYWVVYDFGLCDPPTVIPPAGIFIETHDIEWVGMPGVPPQIKWCGKGGAIAAYGGPILRLATTHDVDGSTFGFDVGVLINDQSLLGSGDGYLIQFTDPHAPGGGSLPPPPGYTELHGFTVGVDGGTWSLVKNLYR